MKPKRGSRLLILLLVLVLFTGLVLFAYPVVRHLVNRKDSEEAAADPSEELEDLSEQYEEITFDEDSGVAFVNDRLIVIAARDATRTEMERLAKDYHGFLSMADEEYGIYAFQFGSSYSLEELEDLAADLMETEFVDEAYADPVILSDNDEEDPDFRAAPTVYPENDPWDGADWSVDRPRDANWGMEAIDAPRAWSFLDQLQNVRVGIIDTTVDVNHEDLDFARAMTVCQNIDTGKIESQDLPSAWHAAEHGTHVAGIMGATWNGVGVSGVLGDKAELYYCYPFLMKNNQSVFEEYHTSSTYFNAIKTLLDQDVRAINISENTNRLIGFAASRGNKDAIRYLSLQADVFESMLARVIEIRQENGRPDFVICVAAGNNNNKKYYKDDKKPYGYREDTYWMPEYFFGGEQGNAEAYYNNFLNMCDEESVKNRIIVVGSVGIDSGKSTKNTTRYKYSDFSNIGSRVDICAPGESIYSCIPGGYEYKNGTSMSTPHVTGAAGMAFAANPELTGPEVKMILLASTMGRFYYTDGCSGMLNLNEVVQRALETREKSVRRVVKAPGGDALDLCFVVDTTSSMGDDIDDAKENMRSILAKLGEKSSSYRVALVDYRDFSERTHTEHDYPAKTQLDFTDNDDLVVEAINSLDLGDGGDTAETVYSGISEALGLSWRPEAKHVIILMGDAPPLDPEPYTDYSYGSIAYALFNAEVSVDAENSDARVLGDTDMSLINVYSISSGSGAEDFFERVAEDTGGAHSAVDNADEISQAINDSIEQIEVGPAMSADFDLGADCAGETVDLYDGKEYLFSFPLDEEGRCTVEDLEPGKYKWEIERLASKGTLELDEEADRSEVEQKDAWYSFALKLWHHHMALIIACAVGIVALLIAVAVIRRAIRRRKAAKQMVRRAAAARTAAPPRASVPTAEPPKRQLKMSKDFQSTESATEVPQTKGFCPHCGTPLIADSAFCAACGKPVRKN